MLTAQGPPGNTWTDLVPFTSLPDGAALAASKVAAPRALGSLGLGL